MEASYNPSDWDMSIVVPTHKRVRVLWRLLKSIQFYGPLSRLKLEVIILDSSPSASLSERDLVELNQSEFLRFSYLQTRTNGVNSKRNLGLDWAQGPVTLFLDDDCEVSSPEFFVRHVEFHHAHPEVPILGGSYDNKSAGSIGRAYKKIHISWRQRADFIPPFVGGNLSLKSHQSATWLRFDESLFFGGTERELILRALDQDLKCKYEPDLIVRHHIKMTTLSFIKKAFLQGRSDVVLWKRYSHLQGPTSGEAFKSFRDHLMKLYNFIFHVGVMYESRYPSQPISLLNLLNVLFYRYLGTPFSTLESPPTRFSYLNHRRRFFHTPRWRNPWSKVSPFLRSSLGKVLIRPSSFIYWRLWWVFFHGSRLMWGKSIFLYYNRVSPILRILCKPYFFLKYQYKKRMAHLKEWSWWIFFHGSRLMWGKSIFLYYHRVFPLLIILFKPYFFLKYQYKKRAARLKEIL